jgi:hypothetical protein
MNRFEIVVEPFSSLYVGGYAQAMGGSDGDTAADALGFLLPGSAVKGALRESAARLVRGAGRGGELVMRLFGAEDRPGLLRVGTLRPRLAGDAASGSDMGAGTVRNHVSLDRATRQAAPQRLFQNRVSPALSGLEFRGVLESHEPLDEEALGLLRSAVRITDQIGGGRGRGLGLVKVSLSEPIAEATALEEGPGPDPQAVILVLEAEEPLHLTSVKEPGNYVTSKAYLDGSAVRGAVAAALVGKTANSGLELVLGGEQPAVFGDGLPGSACAIPAPMTLQVPKQGGPPSDEAAILCAESCGGRTVARPADRRTAKGTWAWGLAGWHAYPVLRRTVTRTARDHASGRAADAQLFSLEVVDPVLEKPDPENGRQLRFYVPVSGSPEQIALICQAAGLGLAVGGDRSRGFGRLRLAALRTVPPLPPLDERHGRWAELVGRLDVPHPETTGVLLAVGALALSQERLVAALGAVGLNLKEGAARRQLHGGWNARVGLPRTLHTHLLPGSTFVVQTRGGGSALEALSALETEGVGPGRADGLGRLTACHPVHVDCFKEG